MLVKAFFVGLLIALAEILNGNIRIRFLLKRFGKKQAKTISFFSGTISIFIISWFFLPWIEPNSYFDCFLIGFVWLIILLFLDIYFGRYIFKMQWSKIADDFNILKGNLLSLGMILLLFSPLIVFQLTK